MCFKTFGAGKLLGDTEGYNQPLKARPRGKVSSGGDGRGAPALPHADRSRSACTTRSRSTRTWTLLGLSYPNEQDAALRAATAFQPLSTEEMARVREHARQAIQGKGAVWWDPPAAATGAG